MSISESGRARVRCACFLSRRSLNFFNAGPTKKAWGSAWFGFRCVRWVWSVFSTCIVEHVKIMFIGSSELRRVSFNIGMHLARMEWVSLVSVVFPSPLLSVVGGVFPLSWVKVVTE